MKTLRIIAFSIPFLLAFGVKAQSPAAKDPLQPLSFLQGTWEAKTDSSSGVSSVGEYSFELELRNHIMARQCLSEES
jgi:hypothetical protein